MRRPPDSLDSALKSYLNEMMLELSPKPDLIIPSRSELPLKPITGMLVNFTVPLVGVSTPGYYIYDGAVWKKITLS